MSLWEDIKDIWPLLVIMALILAGYIYGLVLVYFHHLQI